MKDDNGGARSIKSAIVANDSMAVTINFKWLLQLLFATGIIVWGFWTIESRIQELERNMVLAMDEIELHDEERKLAEEQHIQDMESLLKTELNINPLSWKWGKKD